MNDLKNFPRLVERCAEIGYGVTKVVFRGYHAHDKLQRMHDTAIAQRTELKLSVRICIFFTPFFVMNVRSTKWVTSAHNIVCIMIETLTET